MGGGRLPAFAQPASKCISARESPPPDTATAPGHIFWESGPCAASRSIAAAKSASSLLAAGGFARAGRFREGRGGRFGITGLERAKCGAASAGLAFGQKRLAKPQHTVGTAGTGGIFFDLFGEGADGGGIVALDIGDL